MGAALVVWQPRWDHAKDGGEYREAASYPLTQIEGQSPRLGVVSSELDEWRYLTLAIARDVRVGVVIAAWSSRLSRMYHWDVERDIFTPGQFVKARAEVLAISPNGKYVVYFAEAFHKREQGYIGISHLPYFTAHAFFKQFHCFWRAAHFVSDRKLRLLNESFPAPWIDGYDLVQDRIDPGCPIKIVRYTFKDLEKLGIRLAFRRLSSVEDAARQRSVDQDGIELVELKPGKDRRSLAAFPRERFVEMAAPEWAQGW